MCISTISLVILPQAAFASHCFGVGTAGTTTPGSGSPFTPSANSTGSSGGSAAPDPPSGVTANGLSSSSIRIIWNSISGATSYTVYRASNDCAFSNVANVLPPQKVSPIGQVMKPHFTDSNLPPNTTFAYTVTANNAGGPSDFSNIVDGTTLQLVTPPSSPTGLVVTAVSSTQINLAWSAPDYNGGAAIIGYKIERSINGGIFSVLIADAGITNTYSDTNTIPSTQYTYRVMAINANGLTSIASNSVSATTNAPPVSIPPAPTGLVASALQSQIEISWSKVSSATTYRIDRAINPNSAFVTISTVSETHFSDSNLVAGTRYHYRIYSINSAGTSATFASTDAIITANESGIPSWIKATVGFWASGVTSDAEFVNSIQWFIQHDIIRVPSTDITGTSSSIPSWIKDAAKWWVDGLTSDQEFISAIQYLIEIGVIVV